MKEIEEKQTNTQFKQNGIRRFLREKNEIKKTLMLFDFEMYANSDILTNFDSFFFSTFSYFPTTSSRQFRKKRLVQLRESGNGTTTTVANKRIDISKVEKKVLISNMKQSYSVRLLKTQIHQYFHFVCV